MFAKSGDSGRQLVLCDQFINNGAPVFLDIKNQDPVSLFGGNHHAAAITVKGEVIFINHDVVKKSPSSRIASSSLPGREKAASIACLDSTVFVLSSSGRVFESRIEHISSVLRFSPVSELSSKEIVCLSGIYRHCLAVSSEGCVFGCGSNSNGQLSLGKEKSQALLFTEISLLFDHKIRAAYAGGFHSLFQTYEGKILACGENCYGQLLLSSGPSEKNVYSPTETTITGGATFCIAGDCVSAVFVGNDPPPNTPNRRIELY